MKKLIVEKRPHDFRVQLEGSSHIWGSAPNLDTAIGNMVRTHASVFDIEIAISSWESAEPIKHAS